MEVSICCVQEKIFYIDFQIRKCFIYLRNAVGGLRVRWNTTYSTVHVFQKFLQNGRIPYKLVFAPRIQTVGKQAAGPDGELPSSMWAWPVGVAEV